MVDQFEKLKSEFILNLNNYLDSNKISNVKFAETVGVSETAVRHWRNGKAIPNYEQMFIVCKEMDIQFVKLLGYIEPNLTPSLEELIYSYQHDEKFKELVDRYKSDTGFKAAIDYFMNSKKD